MIQDSAEETFFPPWLMFPSLFNAGGKQSNGWPRQRAVGQRTSSLQQKSGRMSVQRLSFIQCWSDSALTARHGINQVLKIIQAAL